METTKSPFQVSLRTVLEIVAVVAVVLALAYQRIENKNGRFQTTVTYPGPGNGPPIVHVTDTTTGQVWEAGNNGWTTYRPLPVGGPTKP